MLFSLSRRIFIFLKIQIRIKKNLRVDVRKGKPRWNSVICNLCFNKNYFPESLHDDWVGRESH